MSCKNFQLLKMVAKAGRWNIAEQLAEQTYLQKDLSEGFEPLLWL